MKEQKFEKVGELVSIYKIKKSNNWYAHWMTNKKVHSKSLKTTNKKEAYSLADKLDKRLSCSHKSPLVSSGNLPETLDQAISDFLEFLKSEDRAPATIKKYGPALYSFSKFCKSFGVTLPVQLEQRLLDQFRSKLKDEISESTRYHHTKLVNQFGKYLERSRIISKNPFSLAGYRAPEKKTLPFFTLKEVEEILNIANLYERRIFESFAFTGLRFNELAFLTWDDVDLKANQLSVTPKGNFRIKNRKPRIVPIHDRVHDILKSMPRNHKWVFTARRSKKYPDGSGQIKERRILEQIKRVCLKMCIKGCLHSFRHFFASYCANRSVPPMVLMKWLGHSDLKMLIDTYYHLDEKESTLAMSSLCKRASPQIISLRKESS